MHVEVINVQQFPATDPARIGKFDSLIVYRATGGRMNSVTIAKSPVDTKEIEKAIAEHEKSLSKLVGHKFDIP